MLGQLLHNLDDVNKKLQKTTREQIWKDCALQKERYRSLTNIKTILNSLVKRTIRDVNCQNDRTTINQSEGVQSIPPNTQSLLSSDEYLAETKNLLTIPTKAQILHKYLLTFQDLLGDILYSICQINNSHFKFPSRMSVQDLEKLQEYYISISDSLASSSNKNEQHLSQLSKIDNEKYSQIRIEELYNSLQLCLKEMLKVKLEIERYYKHNVVERQFKQNNIGTYTQDQESIEKEISENVQSKSQALSGKSSLSNNESILHVSDGNSEKFVLYVPMEKSIFTSGSKSVERISKKCEEDKKNVSSAFCPSINNSWLNDNINNSSRGLFHSPLVYSDLLFLEAESVLMGTNKKLFRHKSLPKIYSLESITEETTKDDKSNTNENKPACENSDRNKSQNKDSNKIHNIESKQNTSYISLEEDTFSDESLAMDIKAKISSLFSLLRNKQLSDEDLFKEDSRKSNEHFLLNSPHGTKTTKQQTDYYNNNRASENIQKMHKINNESLKIGHNIASRQNLRPHEQNRNINRNYNKPSIADEYEEICDKSSLIELFKTTEIGLTPNTDSSQLQECNNPSSWPVSAKYINVSGSKRGSDNGSDLDDNSISLAKSFEKSLYAIHLNKRYEHKQIYDGNLIVLDNTKTLMKQESENSLMNQSLVVFDVNHCEVSTKKCTHNNHGEDNTNNFSALQTNPPLPYPISILPNINKRLDLDKSMTLQYAQYGGVPYVAKQENYRQRNFDMFNIDGYNDINWNSYISIYTSKIEGSSKIKQHRMFGKIINNIGADYKRHSSLYNNVHTLTSNGGPFRLFDINGYPLTDSVGNVLKDPYGKSLVELDATGFPKNNIKVFDAAGNTPEDINFDPTQKPKTNTIIIKLTDNFKRPLHLFDKYGRPLTDALGKLLVNIHGRPLLRFDNFGRPNTDYRGGPLYTDEGSKWSYKTAKSLTDDQYSEDKLTAIKSDISSDNELKRASSSAENLKGDINETQCKDYLHRELKEKTNLKSKDADIWEKVENILQHLPKRKEFETGNSETSMSETRTITRQNPVEDILKPIIHHNNILHSENCNDNRNSIIGNYNREQCPAYKCMHNTFFTFENNNDILNRFDNYGTNKNIYPNRNNFQANEGGDNMKTYSSFPNDQIDFLSNNMFMVEAPLQCKNYQHHKEILNKNNCQNCLHKSLVYQNVPTSLHNQPNNKQEENNYLNNGLMTVSSSNPENYNNISQVSFKNNDYLRHLCNDIILKYQFDNNKDKVSRPLEPLYSDKTENWTDTSYTLCTGSEDSKYTSDIPTMNAKILQSSYALFGSKIKKLKNLESYKNFSHPYKKRSEMRNILNRIKTYTQYKDSKHNSESKQTQENSKNTFNSPIDENVSINSQGTSVNINVHNQDDTHYEIKVSENKKNIRKENKKPLPNQLPTSTCKTTKRVSDYEVEKVVRDLPNKLTKKRISRKTTETDCCSSKSPGFKKDSPFRFSSNTNIESVIAINDEISDIKPIKIKCNEVKNNLHFSKEYKPQNKRLQNQNDNNTKYNTLPEKSSIEEYNINYGNRCQKVISDTKFNRFYAKRGNPLKRQTPIKKERNTITFLGNPVKYVLNKLDNTFPSRQNNIHKAIRVPTPIKESSKENALQSHFLADRSHRNKTNSPKTKLNHKVTEEKNKYTDDERKPELLTQEKNKYTDDERKHELLAFQSKSCMELRHQHDNLTMNYSGNENESQNSNHTQITCENIIPSCNTLRKCSSATFSSLQGSSRYQFSTAKPRMDQSFFKQDTTKYKQISPYVKNKKSPKESRKYSHSRNNKPYMDTKKPNKDTMKRLVDKGKLCK